MNESRRWDQINAACWRFAASADFLALGAVFLENAEYRSYFNRKDLGLSGSLEEAMKRVENACDHKEDYQ